MDKDKQRIAIAEACGWKVVKKTFGHGKGVGVKWQGPNGEGINGDGLYGWGFGDTPSISHLPGYLSDLNACHEMEKVMNANQANLYRKILSGITSNAYIGSDHPQLCYAEHATAAQRAEAFLRCIGRHLTPTGEENE